MKFVPQSITRSFGRGVLQTKKNSPHIFFGIGLVGSVVSTVLACKATLKLEENVEEIQASVNSLKQLSSGRTEKDGGEYTERDYYKDLGYVYLKGAVKIGKLYGPSILVGTTSIACLTGSHVQLTRRNAALTMTLTAVSKAFEEYRLKIQEEIGEERENDIYRGLESQKLEGKKELVKVVNGPGFSVYARFFDSSNPNWTNNSEYNRIFIKAQQNYANHLLNARGHVFLNDVYDQLGFERTSAGAVVGWVRNGDGDNYIDFDLDEAFGCLDDDMSYILDFNVDGVVYDKI